VKKVPDNVAPEPGKVIRDIVYGYIELTPTDLQIIDTPLFQRLKRIRQLTAFALYPSANQTRFEHCLGVMHLGQRVLQNLARQPGIEQEIQDVPLNPLNNTLRYACLLHDIGHAAFSHVGERFYDRGPILQRIKRCDQRIFDAIGGKNAKADAHELMSCLLLLKHFRAKLPEDVDLELACRMITESPYEPEDGRKTRNPIIQILNSTYDVDRLDYVLRDSVTTGTFGVSIDHERIIRGYAIKKGMLLFLKKSIPSVVNLITGRDFLYQWLYNHHTVAYTDLILELTLHKYFGQKPNEVDLYFSLKAVENGVDDASIWQLLKNCWRSDIGYADRIFERRFHKVLWKTPYDFQKCQNLPGPARQKLLLDMKGQGLNIDESKCKKITDQLISSMGGNEGDILISSRPVKHFDPVTNRDVWFWVNEDAHEYGSFFGRSPFVGATEYPLVFYDPGRIDREKLFAELRKRYG
jgi:HD superfamily phosphohydrolase